MVRKPIGTLARPEKPRLIIERELIGRYSHVFDLDREQ